MKNKIIISIIILAALFTYAVLPDSCDIEPCYVNGIKAIIERENISIDSDSLVYFEMEGTNEVLENEVLEGLIKALDMPKFVDDRDEAEYRFIIKESRVRRFFAQVDIDVSDGMYGDSRYRIRLKYRNHQWVVTSIENIWVS